MELMDNVSKTLKDDLSKETGKGSKVSIATVCFSIYEFRELKSQLTNIDELRFIFTSPCLVTEKSKKQKREINALKRAFREKPVGPYLEAFYGVMKINHDYQKFLYKN